MGTRVFICAGQSNMSSGVTRELPDNLKAHPENLRLFVGGRAVKIEDVPSFGPEVVFAHRVCDLYASDIVMIIKFATGATSLLAWSPEWTEEKAAITANVDDGPMYSKLVAFIRDAAIPYDAKIEGILWMQGERDAKFPDAGREYAKNLSHLMTTLRAEVKAPAAPVLIGRVNPPEAQWPAYSVVRQAQKDAETALAPCHMVDADGVSKRPDNLHYDTAGQIELGKRFFESFMRLGT